MKSQITLFKNKYESQSTRLNLKLRDKGRILVAVPLILQLIFIAYLSTLLREAESKQWSEMHANAIIYEAGNLQRAFQDAGIAVGGYSLTRSPLFGERYDKICENMPRYLQKLEKLVAGNKEQEAAINRLEQYTNEGIELLRRARETIDSSSGTQGLRKVRNVYNELKVLTKSISSEIDNLTADSRRTQSASADAWEQSKMAVRLLLFGGVAANILLSLTLATFFSAGITRRLSVMTENAERLVRGDDLAEPLAGTDEIAQLDHVFHSMADALAEASRKERAVIENAADVICSIDESGQFTKVSPACYALWGYTPDELVGNAYTDLIHPEDLQSTREAAELARQSEGTANFEARTRKKDGTFVTVLWSVYWSNAEKSLFCVAHDITQRKLAEEALKASEARIRSIIDSMIVGLIVLTPDGIIESSNPRIQSMFGYFREELAGKHIVSLFPDWDREADLPAFTRQLIQRSFNRIAELEVMRANREVFPVELSLSELQTNEGPRLIANILDVSERREVERLKREFVSTVSHELRTPLTSIRGSLTLMNIGAMGPLSDQAKKVVDIAERNTLRLINLINDILDIEKLQAGKLDMSMDNAQILPIVERSLESVKAFADQYQVKVESKVTDAVVYADADRIVQVVVNLLSNAIKFSPKGGTVWLTAETTPDSVKIKVIDHGRGIPAKYKDLVFERFQQVEVSDAKRRGGTGLGLTICKGIIEQHGGTIGVDSEEGKGSTFWFRIPATREGVASPA